MTRRIICLLLVATLLVFAGCGATPDETTTTGDSTMLSKDRNYSILFIGNSYTFFNDMPTAYFEPIAKSCGYNITVTTITKGAYTLEKFADPKDPYGGIVANALSGHTKYDYVILQEQSVRPAIDTMPQFFDGVRNLVARIRQIGAQPILYATWGREAGSDTLEKYNFTNEEMTWKLAAAYDAIGTELDVPVVHVGLAFYDVYTGSTISLYNADKSHPNATGSYLAAMALFCKIFGAEPGQIALVGPVESQDDEIIRSAVHKVTAQTPQIPESYKIDSTGITAAQ